MEKMQNSSKRSVSIPDRKFRNGERTVIVGWLFWFQSLIGRFVMQGVKTLMRKYYLFQSLIGRFVILNTPHVHYVGHFNIVAEIMQSFVSQTHKTS